MEILKKMNRESDRIHEQARSRLELYAAILEAARKGAKKTHIAYHVGMNSTILSRYLDHLKTRHLITGPTGRNNLYHTTQKGEEYLTFFAGIRQLVEHASVRTVVS